MPRSVFIATPVYGPCAPQYVASLYSSVQLLERAGIKSMYGILPGHCYVQTARNHIVHQFLESKADDLLFIDADISWSPPDLVRLCGHDEPIVGGVAPFKADDKRFPATHIGERRADGLVEAAVLPTMMLKIQRPVFLKMAQEGYAPLEHEFDWGGDPSKPTFTFLRFFAFTMDDVKHITIGEDVTFCAKWKLCGGKLWLDPDMTLSHHGSSASTGNYAKTFL